MLHLGSNMRLFLLLLSLLSTSLATGASAACNIVNGRAYGDCAGVTVNTGSTPFQVIGTYRSRSGISEGAQVLSGGSLSVSGIADRVIVEQGGTAHISGTVQRLEVSGVAHVSGTVNSILLRDSGCVIVEGIVGGISGNGTALLETGSADAGRPTGATHEVTY